VSEKKVKERGSNRAFEEVNRMGCFSMESRGDVTVFYVTVYQRKVHSLGEPTFCCHYEWNLKSWDSASDTEATASAHAS